MNNMSVQKLERGSEIAPPRSNENGTEAEVTCSECEDPEQSGHYSEATLVRYNDENLMNTSGFAECC
jgi:hypothetical protein